MYHLASEMMHSSNELLNSFTFFFKLWGWLFNTFPFGKDVTHLHYTELWCRGLDLCC